MRKDHSTAAKLLLNLLAATLTISCWTASASNSVHPDVWLAPMAPLNSPDNRSGASDYFELFDGGERWAYTAKAIKVFQIYHGQLVLMTDDQVRRIVRELARRNIALAMEANILVGTAVCGPGVGKPQTIIAAVERLKRLGADLRYLAMNEPLLSGHANHGLHDCQASIKTVAGDAAQTLKSVIRIYPNLKVGDVEPVGINNDSPNWPSQIAQWMNEYHSAMSRPLDFLHADIVWERPWENELQDISRSAAMRGITFGAIYDGNYYEMSDEDWALNTAHNALQVERVLGGSPHEVLFQSWNKWPQRTLPDTVSTTMTGIVRDYLRPTTSLYLDSDGNITLFDENGTSIANAELEIEVHDPSAKGLVAQRIVGEVPYDAVSAVFALRVNTDCKCPASLADFVISEFQFSEMTGRGVPGVPAFHGSVATWVENAGGMAKIIRAGDALLLRVKVKPEKTLSLNSPSFPVYAGAQFELTFSWQVDDAVDRGGYAAIVFLDRAGVEIRRAIRPLRITWRVVGKIRLGANGSTRFSVMDYPIFASPVSFALSYAGDVAHRPTRLELAR